MRLEEVEGAGDALREAGGDGGSSGGMRTDRLPMICGRRARRRGQCCVHEAMHGGELTSRLLSRVFLEMVLLNGPDGG